MWKPPHTPNGLCVKGIGLGRRAARKVAHSAHLANRAKGMQQHDMTSALEVET